MGFESAKHVEQVLREIHAREYLLPAIQREFVWDTDDIVKLFDSLLRGYPVGSFLFWKVDPETAKDYVFYNFLTNFHERDEPYAVRATVPAGAGTTAVLDGQQRLTALNIGLYGSHATRRRYGRSSNIQAYPKKRLYLNLVDSPPDEELGLKYDLRFLTEDEARPTRMEDDAPPVDRWFPVGDVFTLTEDPVAYIDVVSERAIPDIREGARRLGALYTAVRKTPSMTTTSSARRSARRTRYSRSSSGSTRAARSSRTPTFCSLWPPTSGRQNLVLAKRCETSPPN